jgi:CheY-like chemotaxis protein
MFGVGQHRARLKLNLWVMPHSPLRLIVVEDHADTAEGLMKFLKGVGYQVFVATDMMSAVCLASSIQFDLLLSDLALPDGSGWELLKQLNAKGHIRAIALSAHNLPEDLKRSAEAGFVEHLAKPLAPDKLCAAIERAAVAAEHSDEVRGARSESD